MNENTLLHRQVSPSWVISDEVSSQAFRPSKKDEGLLSTYNGDMIEPRESWEHFTITLGFNSVGVIAVNIGECRSLELPVKPDPLPESPAHTVIDFNRLSRRMIERKADSLKAAANRRGWLFRPRQP